MAVLLRSPCKWRLRNSSFGHYLYGYTGNITCRLDHWRQRTVDRSDEHQSGTDQYHECFCYSYLYSDAQSGTCTGPTFTVTVTVNPVPSISNKTASICSGGTFTVTPANGGSEIVPSGTTYTRSTPAISPAGSITGGSARRPVRRASVRH